MTVLVDGFEDDAQGKRNTIARSAADAPEVDGVVVIENEELPIGEFVEVEITDSGEYDLWAKV